MEDDHNANDSSTKLDALPAINVTGDNNQVQIAARDVTGSQSQLVEHRKARRAAEVDRILKTVMAYLDALTSPLDRMLSEPNQAPVDRFNERWAPVNQLSQDINDARRAAALLTETEQRVVASVLSFKHRLWGLQRTDLALQSQRSEDALISTQAYSDENFRTIETLRTDAIAALKPIIDMTAP